MYKVLLCWRYLRTRYLALACIISVMLGVATLIVVNSVMSGFSTKLKDRLHGLLSDVIIESLVQDGFADPEGKMARIKASMIGDRIAGMTPTIETLGLIQITFRGEPMPPRAVRLIGIDAESRAKMGGFAEYLTDARNRANPNFQLTPDAAAYHKENYPPLQDFPLPPRPYIEGQVPLPNPPKLEVKEPPAAFIGWTIGNLRNRHATADNPNKDVPILHIGDEVVIHTVSGVRLNPVYGSVVVADFFKSEMSEYDSNYVFVPLEWLQGLRTMEHRATSLQIKLKSYHDAPAVVKTLQEMFPTEAGYHVETWEDKQGPLLAAIAIEKGILNVLLFLIIGVAGFGILSIFAMIVVEKTRDIGILKALGAPSTGVMNIFLGYGLLLGSIGAAMGTLSGLWITTYLNEIEHYLSKWTGQDVFPRDVYYFDRIPTDIQMWSVLYVNLGAIAIAVFFSILPSLRAAMLHPVKALRYE